MSNVKSIIQNMSGETRARAQAFANAKGLSLEQAVAAQLEVELTESDLSGVVGGLMAVENIEKPDGTEIIET